MGRTHSCARPLNAHQMAAVAILASIIATFFAAYPPLLASITHEEDGIVCESTRTAVLTSFRALSLLVCFLGARTMMIDPSDPNVLAKVRTRTRRRQARALASKPHSHTITLACPRPRGDP